MEVFIINNINRRQTIDNEDHLIGTNNIRYGDRILSASNVNVLNGLGNSITNVSDPNYGASTINGGGVGDGNNGGGFDSSAEDDCDLDQLSYSNSMGLVGLQNIANTCYMNAALQALSNTPPLTGYFLECSDIIKANYETTTNCQRKTSLAKSYCDLVKEMWLQHKRNNGKKNLNFYLIRLIINFYIHLCPRICYTEWYFIWYSECSSNV